MGRSSSVTQRNVKAAEILDREVKTSNAINNIVNELSEKYPDKSKSELKQLVIAEVVESNSVQKLLNDTTNQSQTFSDIIEAVEETASLDKIPSPPNIVPPSPPNLSPSYGNSVRFDFDATEDLISISVYQEGIPVPVEVSFLHLDDLNDDDSFELILSKLQNWDAPDENKLINAIGLDVFIDEIGLTPYKYDNFNVAVQDAISLALHFGSSHPNLIDTLRESNQCPKFSGRIFQQPIRL